MIWGVFTIMLAGLALLFLRPRRLLGAGIAADGQAIFKAQLKALEVDRAEGRLDAETYETLRAETARRLISTAEDKRAARSAKGGQRRLLLVVVALMVLTSGGLYTLLGSPFLPAHPVETPTAGPGARGEPDLEEFLPEIQARLQENPGDLEGWVILARSYASLGRMREAVDAYGRALAIEPEHAALWVAQAEALVELAEGLVTPAALLAFYRAGQLEPENPAVQYYDGVAEFQDGNIRAALNIWRALKRASPADAAWLGSLNQQITRAEEMLLASGVNASREIFPGITAADAAAFQRMSNVERQLFLDGTLLKLRGQLEDNPEDLESWLRVAAIEELLGRYAAALEALSRAEELAEGSQAAEIREKRQALESLMEDG